MLSQDWNAHGANGLVLQHVVSGLLTIDPLTRLSVTSAVSLVGPNDTSAASENGTLTPLSSVRFTGALESELLVDRYPRLLVNNDDLGAEELADKNSEELEEDPRSRESVLRQNEEMHLAVAHALEKKCARTWEASLRVERLR